MTQNNSSYQGIKLNSGSFRQRMAHQTEVLFGWVLKLKRTTSNLTSGWMESSASQISRLWKRLHGSMISWLAAQPMPILSIQELLVGSVAILASHTVVRRLTQSII